MSSLLPGNIEPLPLLLGSPAIIDQAQFEWLAIRPRKSSRLRVYSSPEQSHVLRELERLGILETVDYRELLLPHLDDIVSQVVAYLGREGLESVATESAQLWLEFVLSAGGACLPERASERLAIVRTVLPEIARAKAPVDVANLCGHDAFDMACVSKVGQLTKAQICDWQMYVPHYRAYHDTYTSVPDLHAARIHGLTGWRSIRFQCPVPHSMDLKQILDIRDALSISSDTHVLDLERLPVTAALARDPTLHVNAYEFEDYHGPRLIVEWPLGRSVEEPSVHGAPHTGSVVQIDTASHQPSVFISYARDDNEAADREHRWLDRLYIHLKPLEDEQLARIFVDRHVQPGEHWKERLRTELGDAAVAVLLVSPAFLASDFVRNFELPIVLRRSQEQGLPILSLILAPCAFEETRFRYPDSRHGPTSLSLSVFQAVNDPEHPLAGMSRVDQERTLLSLARKVRGFCTSVPPGTSRHQSDSINDEP